MGAILDTVKLAAELQHEVDTRPPANVADAVAASIHVVVKHLVLRTTTVLREHEDTIRSLVLRLDKLEQRASAQAKELAAFARKAAP